MPTYQRATVWSADDVRAIAAHAESRFFDPDTMRFFSSRLLEGVWPDSLNAVSGHPTRPDIARHDAWEGNRFAFVTSERAGFDDYTRRYTVRILTLTRVRDDRPAVNIYTLGQLGDHATARAAKRAAKEWADNATSR